MNIRDHVINLQTELALSFPVGGFADIGRKISKGYLDSYAMTKDDSGVGTKDFIVEVGNRRRCYINQLMREFAEENSPNIVARDVQMSDTGKDNHVELDIGKFLVTHHHFSPHPKVGKDFLPFPARYIEQNAKLNHALGQYDLFELREIEKESSRNNPFNLLILHSKSEETLAEVGRIEFVFPEGKKRKATFKISELISTQSELELLSNDDLDELRYRYAEFNRSDTA